MQYRKFGSQDWDISVVGFWGVYLPLKRTFLHKEIDEPAAIQMIHLAIDKGVNYVDTSSSYFAGQSEEVVGTALQNGYRAKVRLGTRVPASVLKKVSDFTGNFNDQLSSLQTDFLDFYVIDALTKKQFTRLRDSGLLAALLDTRESGLVRAIGFSFNDDPPVFQEIVDTCAWDLVHV